MNTYFSENKGVGCNLSTSGWSVVHGRETVNCSVSISDLNLPSQQLEVYAKIAAQSVVGVFLEHAMTNSTPKRAFKVCEEINKTFDVVIAKMAAYIKDCEEAFCMPTSETGSGVATFSCSTLVVYL